MHVCIKGCRNDVSPTDVSSNEILEYYVPFNTVSLGLIIPERCVPTLYSIKKELVVTRQFGLCRVSNITRESHTKWIRALHGQQSCALS
jgi:hypothetical protein